MATKFRVGTAIRSILIANEAIFSAVGDNIFPVVAPKETVGDLIVYARDEYSKEYCNMGIAKQKCRVLVEVVSEDYDRSQLIAEAINDALEGEHVELNLRIKMLDSTEDYADGKYLQLLEFSIE